MTRILNNVATTAGIGHIHPRQLRHTLATQAINRGMSLVHCRRNRPFMIVSTAVLS